MPKKKTEVDVKTLRSRQQNLLNARPGMGDCEKILGAKHKVGEFAAFWQNNASDIELVGAVQLLEFATNESYTPTELAAFKAGLAAIPTFLNKCFSEKTKKIDHST